MIEPIRVTLKTATGILDISKEKIRLLMLNDPTFPKPYKAGTSRQSAVYFDYAELKAWHDQLRSKAVQDGI